ncbi:MAG: GtrA family protein [Candidatus Doudnabacteria bacterium]|nr:GtrA family protein [Candidatus Doudnabacteria bacterium]
MENIQTVQPTSISFKISQLLEKYPVVMQLLRFGAIGVFNTTIDVLVLNYMAAQFGVTKGASLGWVNLPGVVLAVIQSYFWNKYWAFGGETAIGLFKNFIRLVAVGLVGIIIYGLVVLGAHNTARPIYFIGIFTVFILAQLVLWYAFGFFKQQVVGEHKLYLSFFVVSAIGFLINSTVLYLATSHFIFAQNAGDNLNIGKILAVAVSLVWNFVGYKIFVFKK